MSRVHTRRVSLRIDAGATRWQRTGWFVLRPAADGGGDISVTAHGSEEADASLVLELKTESGERSHPRVQMRPSGPVWTWDASGARLGRLLVRSPRRKSVHMPGSFVIEQSVTEPAAGERLLIAMTAAEYRSALLKFVAFGTPSREVLSSREETTWFTPSDPRDHAVTRFLPLSVGTYELRLTWHRAEGVDLFPFAQRSDSSWLPIVTTSARSGATLVRTIRFDVTQPEDQTRIYLVPSGSVPMPDDVRLVEVLDARQAAPNAASTPPELETETSFDRAVRWLAAKADAPALRRMLERATEDRLERIFAEDRWLLNYAKNLWELVHGRTILTTYPPDVCIPIADVCNARCSFCTSWLEGTRIATLEEIDSFEPLFRFARLVGLAGHGEPLAHPRIEQILTKLGGWLDPRAEGYAITNGVYLGPLLELLVRSRIRSFAISLNAASPAVHHEVMGLPQGSFDGIVDTIAGIANRANEGLRLSVSLVVLRQNVEEIPAFIELGNRIGVTKIQLKTLAAVGGAVPGLNYHLLPPYEHPDYRRLKQAAVAAIASSRVPVQVDVESWDVPVYPADDGRRSEPLRIVSREEASSSRPLRQEYREHQKYHQRTAGRLLEDVQDFDGVNPFGRTPPLACAAPYGHLYMNDFSFNLSPCCYLPQVPGAEPAIYDPDKGFMRAWNSEAFVALRRRLQHGPLFNMCTKCPGTY